MNASSMDFIMLSPMEVPTCSPIPRAISPPMSLAPDRKAAVTRKAAPTAPPISPSSAARATIQVCTRLRAPGDDAVGSPLGAAGCHDGAEGGDQAPAPGEPAASALQVDGCARHADGCSAVHADGCSAVHADGCCAVHADGCSVQLGADGGGSGELGAAVDGGVVPSADDGGGSVNVALLGLGWSGGAYGRVRQVRRFDVEVGPRRWPLGL